MAPILGLQDVWVAAPPEYRGRKLTSYTQDDGQELGGIVWSKDASTIYYTRGQGPNRAGESPNPTSDPAGAEIALWGGSYGGYLTAMGLSRASDLFAAGVDFHGVHDWNVGIATFQPSYNPLENPDRTRLAFNSSPMSTVDGWRSPVLLIHGDDDRNVRFVETVTLVEALRARHVEVEQLVFPDEIHGFLRWDRWVEAYKASAEFLDRRLGVGKK